MFRKSPYRYYAQYFIPFFLVSLYQYPNLHQIIQLKKINFQIIGYRLITPAAFIKALFLSVITFLQMPQLKRLGTRNWRFLFGYSQVHLYEVFFKYASQILARSIRTPLNVNFSVNDWYFTSISGFNSSEISLFKLPLYNLMFRANLGSDFFFTPKRQSSAFAQRNYLRMLNLPIQYKIGY